jgi:hypothetical protein
MPAGVRSPLKAAEDPMRFARPTLLEPTVESEGRC